MSEEEDSQRQKVDSLLPGFEERGEWEVTANTPGVSLGLMTMF